MRARTLERGAGAPLALRQAQGPHDNKQLFNKARFFHYNVMDCFALWARNDDIFLEAQND